MQWRPFDVNYVKNLKIVIIGKKKIKEFLGLINF